MLPLITHCSIFQTMPALLAKPYDVQCRVSVDSFRTFVSAISGTEPDVTDNNAKDLWLLSDELKFATLSIAVAAWRAAHRSSGADMKLIADVRNVVGRLEAQLQMVADENSRQVLAGDEMRRVNAGLEAEMAGLRQRIEVLEQDNRRLLDEMEIVKGDDGAGESARVKRDMANLERDLAKMRELKAMKSKPEWLAPPGAEVPSRPGPSPNAGPMGVPPKQAKQFPTSVKKGADFDIPDGIIAHLTRECGGNVHDHHIVEVTSGSFEQEINGANPHSGAYDDKEWNAAKNAVDLDKDSFYSSAYRVSDIQQTKNNWLCYDFKERRIVPTYYTIRTNNGSYGGRHLKSWLIETSVDGKSWREISQQKNNKQLNGERFTTTFTTTGAGECRFIRLVNIGRNHRGYDTLCISAWEIFGTLFE
jgi:hypothetical protein